MARGNFDSLVLNVRLDSKQRALQNALLVPWRELQKSADAYVEWHGLVLWVRSIVEATGDVPDGVRSELRSRCPVFLTETTLASASPPGSSSTNGSG